MATNPPPQRPGVRHVRSRRRRPNRSGPVPDNCLALVLDWPNNSLLLVRRVCFAMLRVSTLPGERPPALLKSPSIISHQALLSLLPFLQVCRLLFAPPDPFSVTASFIFLHHVSCLVFMIPAIRSLMAQARGLIARAKRSGAQGNPCPTPLSRGNEG